MQAAHPVARASQGRGSKQRLDAETIFMACYSAASLLAARGLSLAKIAAELNKRKVPTPRGGRWDHSSVGNVLRRLA